MASPYRSGRATAPSVAGGDDGLVDALIQQFADPLAFYRELVQNAIDAGATRVSIGASWEASAEPGAGTMVVSVRDDGCGMSRQVLENQLTVLFRSGKEGQEGKIGKFGIGFVSVLALVPEKVVVRTTTGDTDLWTLELRSDQSYELFQAPGGGSSGTTVTLHVPLARDEVDRFVDGSLRALRKWCRHAELPIHFVAHLVGEGEPLREARVDTPLSVEASISVRVEEGGTTVVAGVIEHGSPQLAFFNRGLLLHETTEAVLGEHVRVSIQDGRLEHTLSRDSVRRDAHYANAMKLARRVIDRDLTRAVHEALPTSVAPDRVLATALAAGLALDPERIELALMSGASESVQRLRRRDAVFAATAPSPLSEAASAAQVAILDLSVAADPARYLAVIAELLGAAPPSVEAALTLASPVIESGSDLALLDGVRELLGEVHRAPSEIRLVTLEGALSGARLVSGVDAPPRVLTREEATENVFALIRRPPLWLDVTDPLVYAARAAATTRPSLAAAVLARGILLDRGLLDDDRDDEWLEAAIERVGEGP